jgi:hypothetical protein
MIFLTDMYPFAPKLIKEIQKYPEQEVGHTLFSLLFRKGQTIETSKKT